MLAWAFWCINIGLTFMVLISLLPIGLMQGWASVQYGTWYARSAEFLQTGTMNTLRWMRVPGDSLFAIGALILGWFVFGLWTGASVKGPAPITPEEEPELVGFHDQHSRE
jgi:nitric oxide reductase subunit B